MNQREQILKRDKYCYICNSIKDLEVHHIQERANNGNHCFYNLITLCCKCHQDKKLIKERTREFEIYVTFFEKPKDWDDELFDKDKMTKITITQPTKDRIDALAIKNGYKQVTTLEYLLSGKISLKEL